MKSLPKLFLNLFITLFTALIFVSCQSRSENKEQIEIIDKTIPPKKSAAIDNSKNLKEKVLLDYIISASSIQPNSKNGTPFDKLKYDKIIAYDFQGSEEPYPSVIDKHGKFVPVVVAQKVLSQFQADKILSALTRESTYGEGTAACFNPHFALVFYRNNKMIHQINICLDCNYLIADIDIPAETHLKIDKGIPDEYTLTGFTKSGKAAIINLCKELNFHYKSR
jgi:hypothetical protein